MKRPRSVRDLAAYLACRSALALLALLPRRAGQWVGRGLGRLFYLLSRAHRRAARANLRRAFGNELDRRAASRLARAAFAHAGMMVVDAAYFPRLLRRPTGAVAVYEGVEHLQAAAALGRGVLVFSGHFGHWELVALLQHRIGLPMSMVVRPLDNPRLDAYLTMLRRRSGNEVIRKQQAARGVLRALRAGRAIAILIDQNVRGDRGVFVDFFGWPASTTPALATFALKSGAPIVPVFSYPLPDGRLRIRYHPALRSERQGTLHQDIERITAQCTGILEEEVRRHPQWWLWMHDRWRTRPAGGVTRGAPVSSPLAGGAPVRPGDPGAGGRRHDTAAGHPEAEARSL
jgi:Kdo2-lipid IVA lauroyltransferase/acyltransferase